MVQEAGVTTDPFVVAVLIGVTRLMFTALAAYISKKFGRRPAALISGVGMTISLLLLATHLVLSVPEFDPSQMEMGWNETDSENSTENNTILLTGGEEEPQPSLIPVFSILLYILTSTLGFLTLPWAMIGEVFPSQVRGVRTNSLKIRVRYTYEFREQHDPINI